MLIDVQNMDGIFLESDVEQYKFNKRKGHKLCSKCVGTGNEYYSTYKKCTKCSGSGTKR